LYSTSKKLSPKISIPLCLNSLQIYEYLLKHPFIEAEDIKSLIGVSKPTVNKLLENLMDMEILELVSDKKRYRQYVYKKYVDILSEGTIL